MKRRDAIRSLYSATSESGKLAMANSRPGAETEVSTQGGPDTSEPMPSPVELAMANSSDPGGTGPSAKLGTEPAEPAPSPMELAMANSTLGQEANASAQAGEEPEEQTPVPSKLAVVNPNPRNITAGFAHVGTAATDRAPFPEKLALANQPRSQAALDERVLAGPVRAMGLSLGRLHEDRVALQEALARGESVVEIDPNLIDPSFVKDRLDHDGGSFADFKRLIEERGQEVPILVRPHPDDPGRYQVAYGHRRLRAVSELGRHVRAIVRTLNDAELVVAQGLENSARLDLTYIEKALFAHRLEDHGFDRSIIIDALSTDKGELSKLIAVARAIPDTVLTRIGPAPKAGRRRWLALAERLKKAAVLRAVEKAVQEDAFAALDSDERFVRVAALATPRDRGSPAPTSWAGRGGQATAQISRKGTSVTLTIDRDPLFGDFVAAQLNDLYAAFLAQESSRATLEGGDGNGAEAKG